MSGISEEQLAEIERDFAGSLSEMKGTPQHCCHLLIAEIRRLRALVDGLRPLAKLGCESIDASNEGSDFDGAEIFELAVKVGAVVQVPFDPEKHEDVHGVGMEEGDTWGEIPDAVLAVKRALQVET